MPELHDLLERRATEYQPPSDLLVRVHRRGRERRRNRRVASAVAAVALLGTVVAGLSNLQPPSNTMLVDPRANDYLGMWESIDADGSSQTLDIRVLDGSLEMVVADDGASICAGAPATMTGIGRLEEVGLVIPTPLLTCDDGTTPKPVDGSSLEDALRNFTLTHDNATDTLTDPGGVTWYRPGAGPDPLPSERVGMWPQATLDEVREAQQRADAGDPDVTWQVDRALDNGDRPNNSPILARFLSEELGWAGYRCCPESFRQGMHWTSDGRSFVEVDVLRCAAGASNALYPDDPSGRTCAPTLDDGGYERLRVTARQPVDDGPDGIWTIQRSQPQPPFRQVTPPSDAEIAAAVEPFLQARVEGQGADLHVNGDAAAIPLLYAASNGAPYERFDHEVQQGPLWPYGNVVVNVRLFADGGQTEVEQAFRLEQGSVEYSSFDRPTTENGITVPEPYTLLDGRVSFAADRSWESIFFGPNGPDTIGFYRGSQYDQLLSVVVDPLAASGACSVGDQPTPSAEALVRSVRSSPHLSVSAPQPARVGSVDAVQLDITADDQSTRCQTSPQDREQEGPAVLAPRRDSDDPEPAPWWGVGSDTRARLYVVDVPGNPAQTVAILIMAPKTAFDDVLEAAQPVIDSFEFGAE